MTRMIFINLPVTDVARATAFYEGIGFTKNDTFSNEQASCMVWSDGHCCRTRLPEDSRRQSGRLSVLA